VVNAWSPLTIITGAASGIGLATAQRLASRGDRLVLVDIAADRLAEVAAGLEGHGSSVAIYPLDVRDRSAIDMMGHDVASRSGEVTYVFSNAGGGRPRPIVDLSLVEWQDTIDTHVSGAFNLCKAVLPYMGMGAILFTASDFAIVGYAGYAHYCAAKAALYSFAKSLAVELAPEIRVNALGPGPIDTPHLRGVLPGTEWANARGRFESEVPMNRLGHPDEVAAVADFLLSDRASYITGQLIQPNGGQVMW
jgi:NAD(P)-dependent dehydrogenase (short-subunit alcohol dehydrogenase family)